MLHRLLALYCKMHITKTFVPDQTMNAILLAESFEDTVLVLPCATDDVGCYANVECAVVFGREEIDGVNFVLVHRLLLRLLLQDLVRQSIVQPADCQAPLIVIAGFIPAIHGSTGRELADYAEYFVHAPLLLHDGLPQQVRQ